MRIRDILLEVDWEDVFIAAKAMKKYPTKWIHFGNIPKLGINPNPKHNDPPAIYFYPIKWLSDVENRSSAQYATESKYYYICDIKKTAKWIDIVNISFTQAEEIAKRNGWFDEYYEVWQNKSLIKTDSNLIWKSNPKLLTNTVHAGAFFWSAMDYLVMSKKRTWLSMLKGVDAIYDRGKGIINANEPTQILVMNRSLIRVLEFGENKGQPNKTWNEIMNAAASSVGGHVYWKNKTIYINTKIDDKPIIAWTIPESGQLGLKYFKYGIETVEYQRLRISQASIEHEANSIAYLIKDAAKNATTTGDNIRWGYVEIQKLLQKTFGNNFLPKLKMFAKDDGSVRYTWSNMFTFGFETSRANNLVCKIWAEFGDWPSYEEEFSADESDEKIIEHIRNGIHKNFNENIVEYLRNKLLATSL